MDIEKLEEYVSLLINIDKQIKEVSDKLDTLLKRTENKKEKQILTTTPCIATASYE